MTALTETGTPTHMRQVVSDGVAKTVTVTLAPSGDFSALSHVFIGVQMFDSGGLLIVDSAGTFTVTVKLLNTMQFETPASNVISALAPTTVSLQGNVAEIKVVPATLSDTDTYQVIAIANRN